MSTVQQPVATRRSVIRVGTRRSLLATTQAGHVADLIRSVLGRDTELVEVTTEGDRSQAVGTPLAAAGGTGVFVGALRDALAIVIDEEWWHRLFAERDLLAALPAADRKQLAGLLRTLLSPFA